MKPMINVLYKYCDMKLFHMTVWCPLVIRSSVNKFLSMPNSTSIVSHVLVIMKVELAHIEHSIKLKNKSYFIPTLLYAF